MTQRGFQMAKVILLWPVTTGVNYPINQSEVLTITYSLHAQKSCVQGAIVIVWLLIGLKNWCKIFKPITNRSNCNCTITFKGHLKTALNYLNTCFTTGFIWIIHTIIFSIAPPQDINAFSTFTFKLVIRTGVVTIWRKKIALLLMEKRISIMFK